MKNIYIYKEREKRNIEIDSEKKTKRENHHSRIPIVHDRRRQVLKFLAIVFIEFSILIDGSFKTNTTLPSDAIILHFHKLHKTCNDDCFQLLFSVCTKIRPQLPIYF